MFYYIDSNELAEIKRRLQACDDAAVCNHDWVKGNFVSYHEPIPLWRCVLCGAVRDKAPANITVGCPCCSIIQ